MERVRRQRLGAEAWRAILAQFSNSGLTAAAFCRREAISAVSFYQWRSRLGAQSLPAAKAGAGAVQTRPGAGIGSGAEAAMAADFVDIGRLHTADAMPAAFELRLDLGGGLTLQLRRG
jgi:hypothetical protein